MSEQRRVSDYERVMAERQEGYAAAADMIGKLLTAWRENEAEIARLRSRERELVERAVRAGWCAGEQGLLERRKDIHAGDDARRESEVVDRILSEGGTK